jgi:hypothetical protein
MAPEYGLVRRQMLVLATEISKKGIMCPAKKEPGLIMVISCWGLIAEATAFSPSFYLEFCKLLGRTNALLELTGTNGRILCIQRIIAPVSVRDGPVLCFEACGREQSAGKRFRQKERLLCP